MLSYGTHANMSHTHTHTLTHTQEVLNYDVDSDEEWEEEEPGENISHSEVVMVGGVDCVGWTV